MKRSTHAFGLTLSSAALSVALSVALSIALTACVDNSGGSLTLTSVVSVIAPQCVADPAATVFRSGGTRDLLQSSLGSYGYILTPVVVNNTLQTQTRPVAFAGTPNIRADASDITIDGFNVCYEFIEARNTSEGPTSTPTPPTKLSPSCKELDIPTSFLSSAGTVTPGGGRLALFVDLFPPALTRGAIGTAPPPRPADDSEIAAFAAANPGSDPTTTEGRAAIAATIEARRLQAFFDGQLAAIAAGGGAFTSGLTTFGATKQVIVHVQAVGRTKDQRLLESNELQFPVQLCVGCLTNTCTRGFDLSNVCGLGQDVITPCLDTAR